jgi:diketogulonate reductase-like aldo/keto reductase
VLPRSTNAKHLVDNLSVLTLTLSSEQQARIDALDGTEGNPWA